MRYFYQVSLFFLVFIGTQAFSQLPEIPSAQEMAGLPDWAKLMYSDNPNVWEVDRLYRDFYRQNEYLKNFHTQYYKHWRKTITDIIDDNGYVKDIAPVEKENINLNYDKKKNSGNPDKTSGSGWHSTGPYEVFGNNGQPRANQSNVYSIDQGIINPGTMYCGTEPGEIYRSFNYGLGWECVSDQLFTDGGVTAIEIDPSDEDRVFAGSGDFLLRTTDAGLSWTTVLSVNNLRPNEILVNPSDSTIVLLAANAGLYRSTDAGSSWTSLYSDKTWDIKHNTANSDIVYMIKDNATQLMAEFFISTDAGATWTQQTNGWYSSSDPARTDGGARIGVTPADSNRIYAYLIGEAKANDYGFIGVYKSTDGGYTWTLPNGPAGGPYNGSHPNLAIGTTTWTYHQGYYNCAIMVSNTNPDSILIGGLNLWRSNDGAATFSSVSGYIGGPLNMHVDNQDFRAGTYEYWVTTDGGIYRSADFFSSQPEVRMVGIHSSDYWGYGQGWNEDSYVGGLYHNGNLAYYQDYIAGYFLSLGGGEAPTGYINPGNSRRAYFSDIGGRILPTTITGPIQTAPFGMSPNETYWSAESSEFEWHPNCYNIGYLGNENKLWKTRDGGGAFELVKEFGTDVNSHLRYIEISRNNPEVMYLSQQPSSGTNGNIWKTTDGGTTWNTTPLPSGPNKRKILLALSPEDENLIWAAFPQAGNGTKIYKSTDGGNTWSNLTTAMLDNESVHSIAHIGGTNGGIYFCTNKTVYYREDGMTDWVLYDTNLPYQFNSNIARPFYKYGTLRIASYGKGIWENNFYTQPAYPIATIMVDKFVTVCETDSFHFDCYSMLNHNGATWDWVFPTGNPSFSNQRNPTVAFSGPGQHAAILTVTDAGQASSTDTLWVTVGVNLPGIISEDFEANFPAQYWATESSGPLSWTQNTNTGGYGLSSSSAICDNYNVDASGTWADMRAQISLDSLQDAVMTFDVAYAEYGGQYTDTLEVLVSTDCGMNFTLLYRKGGQTLATAPNLTSGQFLPSSGQWRTDTVDLSAYFGQANVMVAFRNRGHWGQAMYVDNVNISGTQIIGIENELTGPYVQLSPNPTVSIDQVVLRSNLDETFTLSVFDLNGKVIIRQNLKNGERLNSKDLPAGIYPWFIKGDTFMKSGKIILTGGR